MAEIPPISSHLIVQATIVYHRLIRFQGGPASTTGFLAMTAELLINDANARHFY